MEEETCTTNLTFQAIKDFVGDLWQIFGKNGNSSPLALYQRLIQHTGKEGCNTEMAIDKFVLGFKAFYSLFDEKISTFEGLIDIPRDTFIRYGDSQKVYLEIQKYIYKATPDQKVAIHKHLLTISASINPDEKTLASLDNPTNPILESMGVPTGSKEGLFAQGLISKVQTAMAGIDISNKDPTAAIMAVLSTGVFGDLVNDIKTGVESGNVDGDALLGSLQGTMTSFVANSGEKAPDIQGIVTATQTALMFGADTTTTCSTQNQVEEI